MNKRKLEKDEELCGFCNGSGKMKDFNEYSGVTIFLCCYCSGTGIVKKVK